VQGLDVGRGKGTGAVDPLRDVEDEPAVGAAEAGRRDEQEDIVVQERRAGPFADELLQDADLLVPSRCAVGDDARVHGVMIMPQEAETGKSLLAAAV